MRSDCAVVIMKSCRTQESFVRYLGTISKLMYRRCSSVRLGRFWKTYCERQIHVSALISNNSILNMEGVRLSETLVPTYTVY